MSAFGVVIAVAPSHLFGGCGGEDGEDVVIFADDARVEVGDDGEIGFSGAELSYSGGEGGVGVGVLHAVAEVAFDVGEVVG